MKHAKRDLVCLLLLIMVMALCSRSWAQALASLVVTSDMDCNWKLDGVELGRAIQFLLTVYEPSEDEQAAAARCACCAAAAYSNG